MCPSIGGPFWTTSAAIGPPMGTTSMSILCAKEFAAMRLRDPVIQGGGAQQKYVPVGQSLSSTSTCKVRLVKEVSG